jgi:hypothetical protein
MEAQLTPSMAAIAVTVWAPEAYSCRAAASLAGVMTLGRPPMRPRARAAASPAVVRSRTRSRSNSARAANTWKTSLPPGVVVSIASCRERNPTLVGELGDGVDQVAEGAAEPVELPHDQGVAGAELVHDGGELGPVGAGAAGPVDKDPVAAGLGEGVDLEVGVLVGGGDAGVAEQVAHANECRRSL